MLVVFALLIEGRLFSIGWRDLQRISVSFKKHIVLQKWKILEKKKWKGDMFFSHGTNHGKGVLILEKDHVDFELQSIKVDLQGRYILLEATIQDSPFLLLNIYAPNKCSEQCDFFKTISEELNSSFTLSDFSVIIGGDFNVIFDQELDGSGGLKKVKDSVKVLEDICLEHDLLDIWRVRTQDAGH